MNFHEIQKILIKKMDPKRYEHTLGVVYTSASLCMQHGIDVERGMYAGILHDCAKVYKGKEQYELCKEYHLKLTQVEEENFALLHAKLGAYLAKNIYGINDEEILSSILYHTTGKPNMTTLEKIVYIADYIEPHRELPMVRELRYLAFQNLDKALYQILEMSLEHLTSTGKVIDDMTKITYQFYKEQQSNK